MLALGGCSPDTSGLGGGPSLGGSTRGPDLSTSTAALAGTTTMGVDASEGSPNGTTATSDPSTGGTGRGSGASSSSSSSSGPMLVDTGLLARWFIDEADAGQPDQVLVDSTPSPVNLELVYAGGSPVFTVDGTNRGLEWNNEGQSGRPTASVDNESKLNMLDDASVVTIEVVLAVADVTGQTSRFFHIGQDDAPGDLAIGANTPERLVFRWHNQGNPQQVFEVTYTGERQVIHVVLDTNTPARADSLRAYVDGVQVEALGTAWPMPADTITLASNPTVTLGNRGDGMRSFEGRLHYAALYTAALDDVAIANNAEVLLATDDAP